MIVTSKCVQERSLSQDEVAARRRYTVYRTKWKKKKERKKFSSTIREFLNAHLFELESPKSILPDEQTFFRRHAKSSIVCLLQPSIHPSIYPSSYLSIFLSIHRKPLASSSLASSRTQSILTLFSTLTTMCVYYACLPHLPRK